VLLKRLSRPLIAGLLAALPLTLTLGILFWLADFVHDLLGPESTVAKLLESIGLRFVTGGDQRIDSEPKS